MANTTPPPLETMAEVGRQLRERLIVDEIPDEPVFSFDSLERVSMARESTVDLGTSIELWRLSLRAVERAKVEDLGLRDLAKRIGWHYQFKVNDNSVGFARSASLKDARDSAVEEIFVSDVAQAIDQAINWANENAGTNEKVSDDRTARVLTVPSFQIEALWFIQEDPAGRGDNSNGDVYLVSVPPGVERLRESQFISADTFLEALRDQSPGMGLIHTGPRSG
jgi:hypothetical protein